MNGLFCGVCCFAVGGLNLVLALCVLRVGAVQKVIGFKNQLTIKVPLTG